MWAAPSALTDQFEYAYAQFTTASGARVGHELDTVD